jgi:UDP-glucose 4-epimerase
VSPDATWVVTGGAGYVGGHVVAALRSAGMDVVALDDLSTGHADRLPAGVPLVRGRVGDRRVLDQVLRGAAGVVHLAALTSAPESLQQPLAYYQANVTDLAVLLSAMVDLGVPRLVASSSAAVYGDRNGREALTAWVRDFVHAADIASAHVAAVDRLLSGWQGSAVYNVGTGRGASVLEVIARVEAVTGAPVRWTAGPSRPGDPDYSVASSALIARELGWYARHDLGDCIASAWTAMLGHRSVGADRAAGVRFR